MEELESAIEELSQAFEELKAEVSTRIRSIAESSTASGVAEMEAAQGSNGILFRAKETCDNIEQLLISSDKFEASVNQLEQIYLISQKLREVVLSLERNENLRGK